MQIKKGDIQFYYMIIRIQVQKNSSLQGLINLNKGNISVYVYIYKCIYMHACMYVLS